MQWLEYGQGQGAFVNVCTVLSSYIQCCGSSLPLWSQSRIYMLEQEKKQADLEISRKELEFHQQKKMIQQLEQRLTEERKRKRRAGRKVRRVMMVELCWYPR